MTFSNDSQHPKQWRKQTWIRTSASKTESEKVMGDVYQAQTYYWPIWSIIDQYSSNWEHSLKYTSSWKRYVSVPWVIKLYIRKAQLKMLSPDFSELLESIDTNTITLRTLANHLPLLTIQHKTRPNEWEGMNDWSLAVLARNYIKLLVGWVDKWKVQS